MSEPNQGTVSETPKVSCLTVTANRKQLMKRAVRCFRNQTHDNKELVIIDDGNQDLDDILAPLPSQEVTYVKLENKPENTLGKLRNKSLEEANGDFLVQWDDDDWYHPKRIEIQVNKLMEGYDACCLSGSLMHLDEEPYMNHPYVGYLSNGIPGSIMHRANADIRYPHTRRAEDTVYLNEWMERRYLQLSDDYSHLFIRCYHGSNTWEKDHFLRRIRNNPKDAILYVWYKFVKGDQFQHPRFQITEDQRKAFKRYLQDSKGLGLL
ncbi:Glycosyltransferase involved in cell wall bisynthesis [Fodinibius salinus]|uniref:Glycosyltransferase involved in cell wall bisynthesis n=1 Tax=Fodinibius salinus TaxID=860790 RepID=A0A5D3YPR0_9BACT|nr:glycosyltransferase family 2 protein [Fodinibius salinus]TYP95023.1 Glycosyltransferase involved in cell wall bisynthesis [Fodinibius salinus]